MKINNIIKNWDKEQEDYNKIWLKELKECKLGKIKARVFFNKYHMPICALPCNFKRVYYWVEDYKEISKEDFLKINKLIEIKRKAEDKKRKLIRELLK